MIPDLALTLSFEGIGLLTRVSGGWHLLGEVALDDEDLAGALAQLRAQAVEIAGDDFVTTLVLPNEQIKFLDLPVGRQSEKKRRAEAAEALEAATPYTADQLVFDVVVAGRVPQVAAVARETLAEAEAFAVEHAFNPANFTAIPPSAQFSQAPNFGATRAFGNATGHDPVVIEVVGHGPLPVPTPVDPEPEVTAQEPEPTAPGDASSDDADALPHGGDVAPAPSVEASEQTDAASEQDAAVQSDAEDKTPPLDPETQTPVQEPTETPAQAEAGEDTAPTDVAAEKTKEDAALTETAASTAFASIRAQKSAEPSAAPELSGVTRKVSGTNAPSIPTSADKGDTPPLRFDPTKAVAGLKAERSASETETSNEGADQSAVEDAPATFASARSKTMVAGPAPKVAKKDPKPRGRKAQQKAAKENERQKMTLFGSRQTDVGGKPRHLGLILTALLLVFLGGVALWASLFVEDGISGLFSAPDDTEVVEAPIEPPVSPEASIAPDVPVATVEAAAPVPTPVPEPEVATAPEVASVDVTEPQTPDAAEPNTPEPPLVVTVPDGMTPGEEPDVQTAILEPLSPDSITDSAEIEAMLDDEVNGDLMPEDAAARYAVTGIWQRAPEQPPELQTDSSDDIYIASVDRDTFAFDAVALPAPDSLLSDLVLPTQINPVTADTQFDLDNRGLVVATAEGALSPEGILIFAGRPNVVPAAYPKRVFVDTTALSSEDRSRLATFRPKFRPNDLQEKTERASLGGLSLEELASIRPRARPQSAQEAQDSDKTPTTLVLKTSLRPRAKPSNIAQLASRAQPDTTTTVAAVPAAASVVPAIPTTASVARQATIKNAINLRKTALIGVYGTASNRRALVRLASGRYKKVQVGDRIDGGKVAAIGEDELRYVKGGRNIVLEMPKDG